MADQNSEDEADMFCPALPPHLTVRPRPMPKDERAKKIVGPLLPERFKCHNEPDPQEEESEDDFGPKPCDKIDNRFSEDILLARSQILEENDGKVVKSREEWMLKLPDDRPNIAALGLGQRHFRKNNQPDSGDRSVWTDTPPQKEMKEKLKKVYGVPEDTSATSSTADRDKEYEEIVEKYSENKRNLPLIDTHQKKCAQQKGKSVTTRRPFSREEDLNVHKFDEAQKATIFKKARLLNDRFSKGNQKFL